MRTFVSAPVAIIGIVALTVSQVFAQAGPPPQFNGPVSLGPLSVELRLTTGDAVDTSTLRPPLSTTPGDIVFVSTRDGNPEIYSVKADGTNLTRLTTNPANDDAPVWSPNRTRISFASDRDGSPEIYVMNADGTNVVRRTFSASDSGDPCWSADGNQIVYSTLSNGSWNIWTVSPDSGSPALLLAKPGVDGHPALSPDGSRLAVTSDWYAYDFVYDIFIANADGSGWTGLTDDIFDHVDYVRPSWSPDSAKLAVAITQTTGPNQYITQLGVMNADGSGLTPLISAAMWTKSSWSPDGTTIAFTSGSPGALDISWVSATDGSKSGTIVTNGYSPDWGRTPPPNGVTAGAVSSTEIDVVWNAAPGATSYQIERQAAGGAFSQIDTSTTTTFSDTTATADSAYLYRVRSVNGAGVSISSPADIATTIMFVDNPLASGITVKAVHLSQLRTAVNAVRLLAGLPAATFTDAATAGTAIRAVHVTELREALDPALESLGRATSAYTDQLLTGVAIKAVHLQELRDRVH